MHNNNKKKKDLSLIKTIKIVKCAVYSLPFFSDFSHSQTLLLLSWAYLSMTKSLAANMLVLLLLTLQSVLIMVQKDHDHYYPAGQALCRSRDKIGNFAKYLCWPLSKQCMADTRYSITSYAVFGHQLLARSHLKTKLVTSMHVSMFAVDF